MGEPYSYRVTMASSSDYLPFVQAFDQAAIRYLQKRMAHKQQKSTGEDVSRLEEELVEAHNELLSAFSDLTEYAVEQDEDVEEAVLSVVEKDPSDVPPFAMERALQILKGEAEVGRL